MDLNLRLVRRLIAVVDEGHFGRAADRSFISTPALSQQIRKLEQSLGVDLVDRTSHPVVPTEAGRAFLTDARLALNAADRAVASAEAFRRRAASSARLGFMTASTGIHLREVLDELQRTMPSATVQLLELPWPRQISAVRERQVDAALVRPPVTDTSGLRFDVVVQEGRVAALPTGHPLAARTSIGIGELDDELHVADDEADPAWVRWWACDPRPGGKPVRYGPSVQTMDELLEVVAARQAMAITGQFVADAYRNPGVVFVPIEDIDPCPLSLCTRADDFSPLVNALRRAVASVRTGRREAR
ncbi:putative transcriptional regulator, LysR family [Gordonia polyisoprenivorans VH2]|uniref:Putative transcriptional regulator, LysR family n=1 Tax=Gordonia polyisoprenivorans (strain DSM 44266 / VH2) TaxID=1112204 RepID=H6MX00_GORPV|nr:LysR substrate-binding domain-containing protein [Gordonia polyisoprenivorans]AFA72922.1 putative transcriptional regulator, LysR family [Gordonia polyisoprenivorans VH2]WCB35255.1 LysR substrate-binding domain-containing protein [Gordonia polyisoprenivorans]